MRTRYLFPFPPQLRRALQLPQLPSHPLRVKAASAIRPSSSFSRPTIRKELKRRATRAYRSAFARYMCVTRSVLTREIGNNCLHKRPMKIAVS